MQHQQPQQFVRNRDTYTVQLRKQNREQVFKRRRQGNPMSSGQMKNENSRDEGKHIVVDKNLHQQIKTIMDKQFNRGQLRDLALMLREQDVLKRHQGIIGMRIVVSQQQDVDTFQQVIDLGCVPVLIQFMWQDNYPQLQLQATWILTNIACGRSQQCQSIIDKQGLQAFLHVITKNKENITEQALWGLGNIATDNPGFRDSIIQKDGIKIIIKTIEDTHRKAVIEQGAWVLSALTRGTPRPKYTSIKTAIPVMIKLVMSGQLKDSQIQACLWGIGVNTQSQKTRIQQLVENKGFIPTLISLCRQKQQNEPNSSVIVPSLRVLGNISNGNELQMQELLRNNSLQFFLLILEHPKKAIRRETCWIISNLCVGTASQLIQVLSYQKLLVKIFTLLHQDQMDVKREICYVVGNIFHAVEPEAGHNLMLQYHLLPAIINIICDTEDAKCLESALHALYEALVMGQKLSETKQSPNLVLSILQENSTCLQRLQVLQKHPSEQVYKRLIKIFENFFGIQEVAM